MSAPVTIPATREELAVLLRNCWFACEDGSPMGDWRGVADLVQSWIDTARAAAPAPPDGVQVRMAIGIDTDGNWHAAGARHWIDQDAAAAVSEWFVPSARFHVVFATATVPLPPQEIAATVEPRP